MSDIEYFYSAHSAYAYLGARRIIEIANAAGRALRHRPVDLGKVIAATSGRSFGGRSDAHSAYFFGREMARWGEFRSVKIDIAKPTHHDNSLDRPNGMIIAAVGQRADADALSLAIMQAHWTQDADIADAATLHDIAKNVGIDPVPLLEAAMSEDIQAIHKANTDAAIERHIFGSPTYFVDGDMFYGQDRLELVERALVAPFAAS